MYKRQTLVVSLQVVAFPALVLSAELGSFLIPPFLWHSLTTHLAFSLSLSHFFNIAFCYLFYFKGARFNFVIKIEMLISGSIQTQH